MSSSTSTWIERICIIIGIVLCWFWYRAQGGFEPLVVMVAGIAALSGALVTDGHQERKFVQLMRRFWWFVKSYVKVLTLAFADLLKPELSRKGGVKYALGMINRAIAIQILITASLICVHIIGILIPNSGLSFLTPTSPPVVQNPIYSVISSVFVIAGVVSIFFLAYGGYLYLTSGGINSA